MPSVGSVFIAAPIVTHELTGGSVCLLVWQVSDLDADSSLASTSQDSTLSSAPSTEKGAADAATMSDAPRNVRDAYLESKRVELEANYDRLRALGTVRRDADAQTLFAIRADGYAKAAAFKWAVCADAADALISLAFDVATRWCVLLV